MRLNELTMHLKKKEFALLFQCLHSMCGRQRGRRVF